MKLRFLTGGIIAIHGLIRILFIETYTDSVFNSFYELFPYETALMVGLTIFPFLEFFIGLLIACNLGKKSSLVAWFFISVVMSAFIIMSGRYLYLIYNIVVIVLLLFLYFQQTRINRREIIL